MKHVDVRNLACPGPVLKLRDLLDAGETTLSFLVKDELACSNVTRFARSRQAEVEAEKKEDGSFAISITAGPAGSSPEARDEAEVIDCRPTIEGPFVVQVSGTTMGGGDDELGALLLRSLLKTVAQLDRQPATMVFYNSGVTLCCKDSPVLADLQKLADSGIEILACGTCLNFFGIAPQLAIGRVTDMLEIGNTLAAASRVLRP